MNQNSKGIRPDIQHENSITTKIKLFVKQQESGFVVISDSSYVHSSRSCSKNSQASQTEFNEKNGFEHEHEHVTVHESEPMSDKAERAEDSQDQEESKTKTKPRGGAIPSEEEDQEKIDFSEFWKAMVADLPLPVLEWADEDLEEMRAFCAFFKTCPFGAPKQFRYRDEIYLPEIRFTDCKTWKDILEVEKRMDPKRKKRYQMRGIKNYIEDHDPDYIEPSEVIGSDIASTPS